jgi:hypothetical protein
VKQRVTNKQTNKPLPMHFEISNRMTTTKVKYKCTRVQALRLCTGRTAHRGSRPFHDHGIRRGQGVSVTPRPLFTPGNDPVPIVQEAGWAPGHVWTCAENLAPKGIRPPDRPARSQSLYRLSYRAHHDTNKEIYKINTLLNTVMQFEAPYA